ncbi:hypothetical protein, partial [Cryobacterium sp. MDB2-10]|uniref:hypothetical protein n=1 Tax=Cryobacterium sp. MDB2-10 TaxID=1259177 RepID=UPI001A7EF55D
NSRISTTVNPGLIGIPLTPTDRELTHNQLDAEGKLNFFFLGLTGPAVADGGDTDARGRCPCDELERILSACHRRRSI